jgi:hypothetical protein
MREVPSLRIVSLTAVHSPRHTVDNWQLSIAPMSPGFLDPKELLWKPLFEAAAQTIVGAIGAYGFGRVLSRLYESNRYDGGMDVWERGIRTNKLSEGDDVVIDGFISPYAQLFPGDPAENAKRWNSLHSFAGRITSTEYQALEFFAGSDAALRVGGINGETIVGIYHRYGFVGEGLLGVVPTKELIKAVPRIFDADFVGVYARIGGRMARCPSQHALVAKSIATSAGMTLDTAKYRSLPYIQINSVKPYTAPNKLTCSLLGSVWVATRQPSQQYLSEYGYFSNAKERQACVAKLFQSKAWSRAAVYFDDIACPSKELSFRRLFL